MTNDDDDTGKPTPCAGVCGLMMAGVLIYIHLAFYTWVPKEWQYTKCSPLSTTVQMTNSVDWACETQCCEANHTDSPDPYPRVYTVSATYCKADEEPDPRLCFTKNIDHTACTKGDADLAFWQQADNITCTYNRWHNYVIHYRSCEANLYSGCQDHPPAWTALVITFIIMFGAMGIFVLCMNKDEVVGAILSCPVALDPLNIVYRLQGYRQEPPPLVEMQIP